MTTNKQPSEQARNLARKIFELGDESGSPCKRIAFKGGNWPEKETDQGGMGEEPLAKFIDAHTQPAPSADLEARAKAASNEIDAMYSAASELGCSCYSDPEGSCAFCSTWERAEKKCRTIILSHFRGVESGDERVRQLLSRYLKHPSLDGHPIRQDMRDELKQALAQSPQPPSWQSEKKELVEALKELSEVATAHFNEHGADGYALARLSDARSTLKKAGAE